MNPYVSNNMNVLLGKLAHLFIIIFIICTQHASAGKTAST